MDPLDQIDAALRNLKQTENGSHDSQIEALRDAVTLLLERERDHVRASLSMVA